MCGTGETEWLSLSPGPADCGPFPFARLRGNRAEETAAKARFRRAAR
jgi:hypothetical protein